MSKSVLAAKSGNIGTGIFIPLFCLLIILLQFVFCSTLTAQALAARPFPQHVHYAPGTIRPDNESREKQDAAVKAYYDQWKVRYLVKVSGSSPWGGPLYRISYGLSNPARTVSEGQGYGMLIVTLMAGYDPDAQSIVNGLWAFARQHPSSVDHRLMAWEVPENPDTGIDAAFDGDADMAHALVLADIQWGSGGKVNYKQEGKTLLTAIMSSMVGPQSALPMLGDWIAREGPPYSQYTPRTSDFMPDHFRAWYSVTGNGKWLDVLHATQAAISQVQRDCSPATGLLPDFLVPVSATDHRLKPAPPNFLEGPRDGDYEYNAGRVPWRIGTDALLYGDPVSLAQTRKIADWVYAAAGGRASGIQDGYSLDGTPLTPGDDFTIFFAAPFAVAAMTRASCQEFLNALYDAVKARHEDYYEDSVNLLCLLVMTGNYWGLPETSAFPVPAVNLLLRKE